MARRGGIAGAVGTGPGETPPPHPGARETAPGVILEGPGGVHVEQGLALVADARLDNRAELAARLGLSPQASDAAVIAAAWRAWGEAAPERLAGAFAFALWDAARRRLLCARDPMGLAPLCYRREGGALRLAAFPDALAAALDRPRTLREEAIADFLYGRVLDAENTWFAGVQRLPAGHSLSFERGALTFTRFAAIAPAPFARGEDAPAGLRARLDAAVARQTQGHENVGALLSGGLDSSAIACLARDQRRRAGGPPLPVFTMLFREPARSNERAHAEAVLATGHFAPHILELDGYAPFAGFADLLGEMGGPTLSPNLAAMRHVLAAAAEQGVAVLLDGHGGDEVVSHGYGLLDELAASGAWLALWREARGAADSYGRSRLALTRRVAARQQRLDARVVAKLLAPFDRDAAPAAERPPAHILARDLVQRSRLPERMRGFVRPELAATEQGQHRAVLADPLQPYAFEVHAAFYRAQGLAPRYPFWDRAVVEFCLGLPAQEKLSRGWSRLVLRRAMAGIVPDSVLQRRDKIDFTVHLARGMVRHHRGALDELFGAAASPLAPFVDLPRARMLWSAIAADPDAAGGRSVQMIWRAAALGMWLEMGCGARTSGAVRLREAAA
ncbi:asparagine synthase-related protein [Erythrobacter sp. NE805]|uniref:asparagine synthase-related protein n=1 Tax=Erythrobacter sp. NE805 TaxID=3389875 RepID=UPI00396AFF39